MTKKQQAQYHSFDAMHKLKAAALSTHGESQDLPEMDQAAPGRTLSRRQVLKRLSAAPAALALGMSGCERKPRRQIVSRASGPEYQQPGKALYYSSTYTDGGFPYGMMIKTVDGRPVKIEGNPDHPVNTGASTAQMQASLLSLYDPDRLRTPLQIGNTVSWEETDEAVLKALTGAKSIALMTRSTLGPCERSVLQAFQQQFPSTTHLVHEAAHNQPQRDTWKTLYGAEGEWLPKFGRAKIILSLEADFLGTEGAVLESTRAYSRGRELNDADHAHAEMNRLYVIEGAMSLTGSNADYRIPCRPSQLEEVAIILSRAVVGNQHALEELPIQDPALEQLVEELRAHMGEALVVAGGHLPASVHTAVALINEALRAPGKTLAWNPTPATLPVDPSATIRAAFEAKPNVAIFLGVDPVYDFPGGGFDALLKEVPFSIGHGLVMNDTLAACTYALPSAHMLESWNDAQPRDGLMSLAQPVLAPLFDGRQEAASLLLWAGAGNSYHDYLRQQWKTTRLSGNTTWEQALKRGVIEVAKNGATVSLDMKAVRPLLQTTPSQGVYELQLAPHPAMGDGRFSNNAWLHELPDPVSKLVWDSAASMSAETAAQLGVKEGDQISVTTTATAILPVLIQPGMAMGLIQATLGYGHARGGAVTEEAGGMNAAVLLADSDTPQLIPDVQISKAAGRYELVRAQEEFSMHNRPIALDGTLAEYQHTADFVKHKRHLPKPADLYTPVDYSKGHKWEMVIDLGACTGCSACMVACQAENNIAVVGKDECSNGREMHWIRIDRYEDDGKVHHQPMLCQHCDNAPCENVCPVNATSHSPEGLNEMTYNRCVGTRYCANNCPYKVRRFNFLRYQQERLTDPVQELQFNPQVTVRGVGVMEKCTFCIQRINCEKFNAQNKGETLPGDAIVTACQQACPAKAIVFGDTNDPMSAVAKLKANGRAYAVLEELNVKPSVQYLARVRNVEDDSQPQEGGDHE